MEARNDKTDLLVIGSWKCPLNQYCLHRLAIPVGASEEAKRTELAGHENLVSERREWVISPQKRHPLRKDRHSRRLKRNCHHR
jgi:hypothetical protein